MNEVTLQAFRAIAHAMNTEPTDWQWIGPHMSQRMFGITEQRAKAYAERHGGEAKKMQRGMAAKPKRCSRGRNPNGGTFFRARYSFRWLPEG